MTYKIKPPTVDVFDAPCSTGAAAPSTLPHCTRVDLTFANSTCGDNKCYIPVTVGGATKYIVRWAALAALCAVAMGRQAAERAHPLHPCC